MVYSLATAFITINVGVVEYGGKMKGKLIQKCRLTGLLIALMILLTSCGISSDLCELSADISTYRIVYKSERGFGNDPFDIYSFSLKKQEDISGFHMLSEESAKHFRDFLIMIEAEAANDPFEASSLIAVKADIENIRNPEDGQYPYVRTNGTRKLYV